MRIHRWSRWLRSGAMVLWVGTAVPTLAPAQVGIPGVPQIVFDPSNLAKNAVTAAQTVLMVQRQLEQLQLQVQALRKLGNPSWREIDSYVRHMEYLLEQGEAIGYTMADLEEQFRGIFPGYRAAASNLELPEAQRVQAQRTLGTMRAALNVLHAHAQQFRTGRAKLDQIKGQMAGIRGTQEALELQATLDAFLAEEVGLLRQTVSTQANLQAVYNAYQISQQEEMRANYRAMMDRMSTPPEYRADYSLRLRR